MSKGMTDAEIDQYLASVRRWPTKPTDYGPETEAIIRRALRGEIKLCSCSDCQGTGTEPAAIQQQAGSHEAATDAGEPAKGRVRL